MTWADKLPAKAPRSRSVKVATSVFDRRPAIPAKPEPVNARGEVDVIGAEVDAGLPTPGVTVTRARNVPTVGYVWDPTT